MSQRVYQHEGKTYYEIVISRRGGNGTRIRRRVKFDGNGRRIAAKQVADKTEYRLRKEVESIYQKSTILSWGKWHEQCLERMRDTLLEGTVATYDGPLKKRLPQSWNEKQLSTIARSDVHDLIFNTLQKQDGMTRRLQKTLLERLQRLFEMAVEDDLIANNPARKIVIKVPPPKQKVLNANQASTFWKWGEIAITAFITTGRWPFFLGCAMVNSMPSGGLMWIFKRG